MLKVKGVLVQLEHDPLVIKAIPDLTLKMIFQSRKGTKIFCSLYSFCNEPSNAQFSFLLVNAVALIVE